MYVFTPPINTIEPDLGIIIAKQAILDIHHVGYLDSWIFRNKLEEVHLIINCDIGVWNVPEEIERVRCVVVSLIRLLLEPID